MGQQLLAFFVHSRQQASTPSTVQSTVVASPLHPTTREEAPKQCLVLRAAELHVNDVWNDVKTTSSCEEQPVFGDSTTRPGGTCGSATTGTIYCTFKTANKHAQHSAICWAARWNTRATNRSLFPLLPEEAPKLCLVLRTG